LTKLTIYINHTQLTHFFYTFTFLKHYSEKFILSKTENLEPPKPSSSSSMASSSAKQVTGSSDSGSQIISDSGYMIKPKTMSIPIESFEVQVESPVDFASLKKNGMNLEAEINVQQMFEYFNMLNGPTYSKLVKDFWIKAEVYDLDAAKDEEDEAVIRDPSLKGKTRQEMGLESFRQTKIRSTVIAIPVTITEEVIAKACRVTPTGRFLWNITGKHPLMASYTSVVLKGDSATKMVNIDNSHRMLLKFLTECFLQKGGGSDQPSADHKLVLYFLASFNKINLPRYIMHHL